MPKRLILWVRPYSFKDKESGRNVSGINAGVMGGEVLNQGFDDFRGVQIIDTKVRPEALKTMTIIPGIYMLDIDMVAGAKSKGASEICAAEFLAHFDPNLVVDQLLAVEAKMAASASQNGTGQAAAAGSKGG
jgi:hypothetical protein